MNENPQGPYRTRAQENETLQALRSLVQSWRLFWASLAFLNAIAWKGLKNDLQLQHNRYMLSLAMAAVIFTVGIRVGEFVGYSHNEAQAAENARLHLVNEQWNEAYRSLSDESIELDRRVEHFERLYRNSANVLGPVGNDVDAIVADDYGIVCHVSEIESDGKMELCP